MGNILEIKNKMEIYNPIVRLTKKVNATMGWVNKLFIIYILLSKVNLSLLLISTIINIYNLIYSYVDFCSIPLLY